jgi:hypothetical protein
MIFVKTLEEFQQVIVIIKISSGNSNIRRKPASVIFHAQFTDEVTSN